MSGWIKLHRELLDWEWYSDHSTTSVFIHLLLLANYEDGRYLGHSIPRGACVIGRNALAETLGLTPSKVRTALFHLENSQEIAIKVTNKFSIITIIKWDKYQGDDQQIANRSQTDRKQIATSKERKKERKVGDLPDWLNPKVWEEFLEHRRQIKSPITDLGQSKLVSALERHRSAGYSPELLLNRAIENGWKGVFLDGSCRIKQSGSRGALL